ncbi:MAG: hypothetical protein SGJ20_21380 [Planctomycetota bacterium]|nr:hypothetical protein [Planctomycetota bacterium]
MSSKSSHPLKQAARELREMPESGGIGALRTSRQAIAPTFWQRVRLAIACGALAAWLCFLIVLAMY